MPNWKILYYDRKLTKTQTQICAVAVFVKAMRGQKQFRLASFAAPRDREQTST